MISDEGLQYSVHVCCCSSFVRLISIFFLGILGKTKYFQQLLLLQFWLLNLFSARERYLSIKNLSSLNRFWAGNLQKLPLVTKHFVISFFNCHNTWWFFFVYFIKATTSQHFAEWRKINEQKMLVNFIDALVSTCADIK